MPLPRFEKLDPERRAVILDAAKSELLSNGFQGASYNAIIRAAGLSKGAMYYYFADKADLCRAVIDREMEPLFEAAGELGPHTDAAGFWAEIEALNERALGVALGHPDIAELGRLIYGAGSSSEVLAPYLERAEAWLTELLREGRAVGAVREDLPLGLLASALLGLLTQVDRWLATHMESLPPEETLRLSYASLDMVRELASPISPNPDPQHTRTATRTRSPR